MVRMEPLGCGAMSCGVQGILICTGSEEKKHIQPAPGRTCVDDWLTPIGPLRHQSITTQLSPRRTLITHVHLVPVDLPDSVVSDPLINSTH